VDFEARFHRVAQRRIPPHFNTGYPPLVVFYFRHLPIRVDADGRPRRPLEPDPRLLEAARRLGSVCDVVVIASNTPHLFMADIERAAGRPVLDMVALAVDEVERRGWRRVGVVGFSDPVVYTTRLMQRGLACETLDAVRREALDAAIGAVMEGREDEEQRTVARRALEDLRARGAEGIVLGCTEIPLLLGAAGVRDDLLNPLELLAEAAVRLATED
jgi:aspartate racemase